MIKESENENEKVKEKGEIGRKKGSVKRRK